MSYVLSGPLLPFSDADLKKAAQQAGGAVQTVLTSATQKPAQPQPQQQPQQQQVTQPYIPAPQQPQYMAPPASEMPGWLLPAGLALVAYLVTSQK